MKRLLLLPLLICAAQAQAQGVSVTAKPCAAGASEVGGLCVAPLSTTPVPPLPVACQGTPVAAGANIQTAIDGAANGATLCLATGTFRIDKPIAPKTDQRLVGVEGSTILNGTKVVTGWAKSGTNWVATGFLPSSGGTHGECSTEGCTLTQDVFFDGKLLKRAMAQPVNSGSFYEDFPGNKIYLGQDPSGHTVEQAFASSVVRGTNKGVHLTHLTIVGGANEAQVGAVECTSTSGWVLDHLNVAWNHGAGVFCDSYQLLNSRVHHNGQIGVGGHGDGTLIDRNEIDHNGFIGYAVGWEAGGTKWASSTTNGIVSNNNAHDNNGIGLWCDVQCYNWKFTGNTVKHNSNGGIFYEISNKCLIENNVAEGNGPTEANGFYNAGDITISASPNCEVRNNSSTAVVGIGGLQQNRGATNAGCKFAGGDNYPDGQPVCENGSNILKNLFVHDNVVNGSGNGSMLAGVSQDVGDASVFTSRDIRFENNRYSFPPGYTFTWDNKLLNYDAWKAYGLN